MTSLKKSSFECPACGTDFIAKTVSSITHQGQDSDFLPHYLGKNPLPLFLAECPKCGFCGYPEDYSDPETLNGQDMVLFVKNVMNLPIVRKIPREALRFFVAARIYEENKRNPHHIGNLYLRGSWCCRLLENRKAEVEMQQLAVKYLRLSVEKSTLSNPDNLPVLTYLVGELYRRLEDRESAREWFSAVEDVITAPDQQWILDLTQKQAELNEHLIN